MIYYAIKCYLISFLINIGEPLADVRESLRLRHYLHGT